VNSISGLRYVDDPWKLTICQLYAASDVTLDVRNLCLSLFLLMALLFPGAAVPKIVPPGNSGADQYAETLPGPGGNQSTNPGGGAGGRSPGTGASTQRSPGQLGPAGGRAAGVVPPTGPPSPPTGAFGNPAGGANLAGGAAASADNPSGSSGFVEVLKQAGGSGDSGGMGIALPLILAGSLLAAIVRLRRRS
jgi:hypothetical protein